MDGGAGTNNFTANNVANTWNISSVNGGSVTGVSGAFSNIQNLTGGSSADSFALNGGTLSGNINGGAGTNNLAADNVTNSWMISAVNGGTVTGIGGTFANIQNLFGGSGTDTFTFSGIGALSGSIDGGADLNTLIGANTANIWTINATNGGLLTSIGGSFGNIQT